MTSRQAFYLVYRCQVHDGLTFKLGAVGDVAGDPQSRQIQNCILLCQLTLLLMQTRDIWVGLRHCLIQQDCEVQKCAVKNPE